MAKLTFWDKHNADYPLETLFCEDTGKYLKAAYVLDDSADSDTDYDIGIFSCGYGEGTLNNVEADNLYSKAHPEGSYGPRWYHKPKYKKDGTPAKCNIKITTGGVRLYKKSTKLQYPDKLIWVLHTERYGKKYLYKPQLLEKSGGNSCYSRGEQAFDVTHMSLYAILDKCNKEGGLTYSNMEGTSECIHSTWTDGAYYRQLVNWSVEMDGKSIIALLAAKPKMTYNEILNVIVNEGGSVDSNGIIHRPE